jgi:hypothetical protein
LLSGVLWAAPAQAQSRAFVEIGETDGRVNPAVLRRLVALELSEISMPVSPRQAGDGAHEGTLHCRVLPEDGALRVEVWSRGESAGARRVSLQGTPALVARRVALAAAELARRLAHQRQAEARKLVRELLEAERLTKIEAERRRRRTPALATRARAVGLFEGAYLAGPSVAAQLNGDHPLRVEFGASWLAGGITELRAASPWSAVELEVTPAWVVPLSGATDLAVGVPLQAGWVQAGPALARTAGERDAWMLRAGLELRVQPRLSSRVRLDFGAAVGTVLRGVRIQDPGEPAAPPGRLGGSFAALSAGVLLD